jgi:hypothetical protein
MVFPGEMLSFQALFQVTEQKEVAQCEVWGMGWLKHQDEVQLASLFMEILEVCGLALST